MTHCKWHIFFSLQDFKPFLWLNVLKVHYVVNLGGFSPIVVGKWYFCSLETHIFQFWNLFLNSFFDNLSLFWFLSSLLWKFIFLRTF
jgi:hypothetical protein